MNEMPIFGKFYLTFAPMRLLSLILSLYMFTGSIMPGGHWDELPGVFNLIGHFHEHQHRTSDHPVTFMEFLSMHYDAGQHHQQQEDHSQLPFNHVCSGPLIAIVDLWQHTFSTREINLEKVFTVPVFMPRIHIADLLQPPRY